MNILFSSEDYPTADHPFASFVGNLCRELTKQGHTVTVIAPQSISTWIRGKGKLLPKYSVDMVKVGGVFKEIKVYRPYFITFKRFNFFKKSALQRIANNLPKPDICYAHFWTSGNRIFDYSQKNKIPLFVATGEDVITIHNRLSEKRLSLLRNNTAGVICVSTKNMTESVSDGLTVEDKCIVIPNSVNNTIFYPRDKDAVRHELGYGKDDFIVAFVGRFDHRKGVMRVSEAIKQLSDSDIKSIFIGKSSVGENLQPDCAGILFNGPLPHEEIPKYLSAADVFVLPSLAEGCSNSIIEAMACGLPIISSNLPFNYDILNSENSYLIDPNDITALARCISILKDNVNVRHKMGISASETAANLTLSKRTAKIIDFIKLKTNSNN